MAKDLHTYYWPELSAADHQVLRGDEAKHAIRVMRVQLGESLRLIDGRGYEATAEVRSMTKKDIDLKVSSYMKGDVQAPSFHLAIAPTKQIDRIEWCLEKCTEIGLARFTPIICQNSERRKLRTDRLKRIAISAMKQSGSAYLPQVDEPIAIGKFLAQLDADTDLHIAHCRDQDKGELSKDNGHACVMIGPEGDFSDEEVAQALAEGAKAVHLGAKRLRTETAAVVACTLINIG